MSAAAETWHLCLLGGHLGAGLAALRLVSHGAKAAQHCPLSVHFLCAGYSGRHLHLLPAYAPRGKAGAGVPAGDAAAAQES